MTVLLSRKPLVAVSGRPLRLGCLALTEAAPLVVAQELGLFRRHGLKVVLEREPGWTTIREKLVHGDLDAAPVPAPLLWSTRLGLDCPPAPVLTAFAFGRGGMAVTLSRALHEAGVRDAASLRTVTQSRRGGSRLTLGISAPFSSSHLLLRQWLTAAAIRPGIDVRLVVVPPAQMFRNLQAGTIGGYCASEPWNSVAVRAGDGWCPTWSAAQTPGRLETVLMVTEAFAMERAEEHAAMVRALVEAAAWCDQLGHRPRLATLLAAAPYLNLPERAIRPALLDTFDCGQGRVVAVPDFVVFHRGGASVPSAARAAELQRALVAAKLLPAETEPGWAGRLFREELFRAATGGVTRPAALALAR